MRSLPDSKQAVRSAARRLGAWTRRPFDTGYRWGLPLALYAGLCLALPAGAGLALFLPPALALAVKAVRVSQRIHRLDFVRLVDENGTARLDTETDRLQRAWVLGCIALVGLSAALLVSRAALALLPGAELSGSIALYLGFAAVLLGGFLLLYYVALRFDNGLARGLASIAVTLPAFFVIVAFSAWCSHGSRRSRAPSAGLPRRPSLTGSPGSTTSSACSDRRRTTSCARTP